jgi:hypothetical protein
MIDVHLEPIPKIDRVQLVRVLFIRDAYKIESSNLKAQSNYQAKNFAAFS